MGSKITKSIFFSNFLKTKTSNFISYMNDDFYEDSFEVYNIFLGQKLTILEFLPKIFFILTSVTSETSWGQTMSFSDLTEVSNFSWRCQLSYEVLLVELGWKLKHPETAISQRVNYNIIKDSNADSGVIFNFQPSNPHYCF